VFIINAPFVFRGAWGIIKMCIDPVTVKKFTILGSSYLKELSNEIPMENLPIEYGGKSVLRDSNGKVLEVGCWLEPSDTPPL